MYTAKQLNSDKMRTAVLKVLEDMPDAKHKSTIMAHILSGGLEVRVALRSIAADLKPKRYLEIGVGLGWSMAQVLEECRDCKGVGIDKWIPNYAGWTLNPQNILREIYLVATGAKLSIIDGDSRAVLASDRMLDETFDLIFIDGDHSEKGARFDLFESAKLLNDGGVLVFDDLVDANEGGRLTMVELWAEFKDAHPDWEYGEFEDALIPFGIAIKPNAKKVEADVSEATSTTASKKKTTSKRKTSS